MELTLETIKSIFSVRDFQRGQGGASIWPLR